MLLPTRCRAILWSVASIPGPRQADAQKSERHSVRESVVEDRWVPLAQIRANGAEGVQLAHSRLVRLPEWRSLEMAGCDPFVLQAPVQHRLWSRTGEFYGTVLNRIHDFIGLWRTIRD